MKLNFIKIRCLTLTFLMINFSAFAQDQSDKKDIVFNGKFEQGALIRAQVEPGTQVQLNSKKLDITEDGQFVFGFERDANLNQELVLLLPNGQKSIKHLKISKKHYNLQKVSGISPQIMNPNSASQKRAVKDSQMVKAARSQFSNQSAFTSQFIWPITGRISGVYGSQRVYNDKPGTPHFGVDIARATGSDVVAPADGIVTLAVPDMFYSGGTMIIDHGYGVNSTFLHLSQLNAKVGDKVKQGQKVAKVGATGRATGPHLDWRLNWYQMRLDPTTVVPSMAVALKNQ